MIYFWLLALCLVVCGVSAQPKLCTAIEGCVVSTPEYWTRPGGIEFNFSGLSNAVDDLNDRLADYQWGLGSAAGLVDIIPIQSLESAASRYQPFNVASYDGQTVETDGGTFDNRTVFSLNLTLQSQTLTDGGGYYVTVLYNEPGLQRNASSNKVQVVTSEPEPRQGGLVYPTRDCTNTDSVQRNRSIWICWEAFADTVVPVHRYAVQLYESDNGKDTTNLSAPVGRAYSLINDTEISSGGNVIYAWPQISVLLDNPAVQVGSRYFVSVSATNDAGLTGQSSSGVFLVTADARLNTVSISLITAGAIVAALLILLLFAYLFFNQRQNRIRQQKLLKKEKQKHLKSLMYGLVMQKKENGKTPGEIMRDAKEHCFVITDLENSTSQSEKDPKAFAKIQEIHDTVIREGINKNKGYEIYTEGDAFAISFLDVPTAVIFAMDIQYRLTDTHWPKEILKLPSCGIEYDKDGDIVRKGPRVRMGIHFATEGSVVMRVNQTTFQTTFYGPGFSLAQEVSDAANGGQVLLTESAWQRLAKEMPTAGFPTVAQLGLYKFDNWQNAIWIYEVTQVLGRKAYSPKKPLRKHDQIESGWGYGIVPPPVPRDSKFLTFVYCRLDTSLAGTKAMNPAPYAGSYGRVYSRFADSVDSLLFSIRTKISRKKPLSEAQKMAKRSPSIRMNRLDIDTEEEGFQAEPRLMGPIQNLLYDSIAISAMQFGGYLTQTSKSQGSFAVAFATTLDALRFAHAAQVRLLYTDWHLGEKELTRQFGPTEYTPDARLLFNGPRIAMALHETCHFASERVDLPSAGHRESELSYHGNGVNIARALQFVAYGGQVVLSETAWACVQDRLPGSTQSVSLGTHLITEESTSPMLLMENMPIVLHLRSFANPLTYRSIDAGYRDSPDPKKPVAIVFTKIHKPGIVQKAEKVDQSLDENEIVHVLTQFNMAVVKMTRIIRRPLNAFNGYECKEPEPGKLTLAFHTLEAAIRWSCVVTKELLETVWPPVLSDWDGCKEEHINVPGFGDALIWSGPKFSIGMTYGKPQYRKPLNSGRADYYGSVPNLASRILHTTNPGQILIEGSSGFANKLVWPANNHDVAVLPVGSDPSGCVGEEDIEIKLLGFYKLKGFTQPRMILQATPMSLTARHFEPLTAPRAADILKPTKTLGSRSQTHSFASWASSDSPLPSMTAGGPFQILARRGSSLMSHLSHFDLTHKHGKKNRRHDLGDTQPPRLKKSRDFIEEGFEEDLAASRPNLSPGQKSPVNEFASKLQKRVELANNLSKQSLQRQLARKSEGSQTFNEDPYTNGLKQVKTLVGSNKHLNGEAGDIELVGSPDSDLQMRRQAFSTFSEPHSLPPSAGPSFTSQPVSLDCRTSISSLQMADRVLSSNRSLHEDAQLPPRFPSAVSSPPVYSDKDEDETSKEFAAQLAQSFVKANMPHKSQEKSKSILKRADTPTINQLRETISLPASREPVRPANPTWTNDQMYYFQYPREVGMLIGDKSSLKTYRSPTPEEMPRSAEALFSQSLVPIATPISQLPEPEASPFQGAPTGPDASAFLPYSSQLRDVRSRSLPPTNSSSSYTGSREYGKLLGPYSEEFRETSQGQASLDLDPEVTSVDSPRTSAASTPRMRTASLRASKTALQRHAILDVMHRKQVSQDSFSEGQSHFLSDSGQRGEISTVPEEPDDS